MDHKKKIAETMSSLLESRYLKGIYVEIELYDIFKQATLINLYSPSKVCETLFVDMFQNFDFGESLM